MAKYALLVSRDAAARALAQRLPIVGEQAYQPLTYRQMAGRIVNEQVDTVMLTTDDLAVMRGAGLTELADKLDALVDPTDWRDVKKRDT